MNEKQRKRLEKAATNPYGVKVGELWIDNDPRERGRRWVRVIELDGPYALVKAISRVPNASPNGPRTRVRLDRFHPTSTGYVRYEE